MPGMHTRPIPTFPPFSDHLCPAQVSLLFNSPRLRFSIPPMTPRPTVTGSRGSSRGVSPSLSGKLVTGEAAEAWLSDLAKANELNEYMFCLIAVVTRARL